MKRLALQGVEVLGGGGEEGRRLQHLDGHLAGERAVRQGRKSGVEGWKEVRRRKVEE